ncbi:MAG: hypothetical protein ACRD0U_09480 [Acidimicrobiales bacterium]
MTSTAERLRTLFIGVFAVVLFGAIVFPGPPGAAGGRVGAAVARLAPASHGTRDVGAYGGLGAWIDAFDYVPAYQTGGPSAVRPAAVDDMAAQGVTTLFVQAARNDPRSPNGIADREVLAQFLVRAHRAGLRVVAWYLPRFADIEVDLRNLLLLHEFEVLGHRFDGLAVDIEFTEDVPDHAERGQRLLTLTQQLRERVGDDALGAIVLPPVQTEVINPRLWPDFPWGALAPLYDVWLPMSYWTFRSADSGYQDAYTYNEESIRRLRANLDRPTVPVHAIGGIGDALRPGDLDRFGASLVATDAVGGSIYDWATLSPADRADLAGASGPEGPLAQD